MTAAHPGDEPRVSAESLWDEVPPFSKGGPVCGRLVFGLGGAVTRSLASYAGHLRHGAAWHAWTRLWEAHPWLLGLFRRQGWTLAARWGTRPRPAVTVVCPAAG